MRRYRIEDRTFSDINITPFTDIILVLLIIFMVSAPIYTLNYMKIALPTAKYQSSGKEKAISIMVTQDGKVTLDGENLQVSSLENALKTKISGSSGASVTLFADKGVSFSSIVNVLDIVKSTGTQKISIVTQKK